VNRNGEVVVGILKCCQICVVLKEKFVMRAGRSIYGELMRTGV
jgi:hypothetical protein